MCTAPAIFVCEVAFGGVLEIHETCDDQEIVLAIYEPCDDQETYDEVEFFLFVGNFSFSLRIRRADTTAETILPEGSTSENSSSCAPLASVPKIQPHQL